jgi:hypothetical protein
MRSQPHVHVIDIDSDGGPDPEADSGGGLRGAVLLALLTLVPLAVYVPAAVVVAGGVALLAILAHHLCSPGPGARA